MRTKITIRHLLLILCALAGLGSIAHAEEKILSFKSTVRLNPDTSLDIRETIQIESEGREIQRGILRNIPTRYDTLDNDSIVVDFTVLEVLRDGTPEPYSVTSGFGNDATVRIGSPDVFIPPGTHTYEIRYQVTRLLRFFEDFDELYWNVTGDAWTFPIEGAELEFHLPEGATELRHAGYTGPRGARGQDFVVLDSGSSVFRARTNRRLRPGEGFTIAVAWPKGFVAEPSEADQRRWWLADHRVQLILLVTVLVTAAYLLLAWFRVGRDPMPGKIAPSSRSPEGMCPASARQVTHQLTERTIDARGFTAALLGLAVKGHLRIRKSGDRFVIERVSDTKSEPLTSAETSLKSALPNKELEIHFDNRKQLVELRKVLEAAVAKECDDSVFATNKRQRITAAVLTLVGMGSALWLMPVGQAGAAFVCGVHAAGACFVALALGKKSFARALVGSLLHSRSYWSIVSLMIALPVLAVGILMHVNIPSAAIVAYSWAALALFSLHAAFSFLLRTPTARGRLLLDSVESYRLYLTTLPSTISTQQEDIIRSYLNHLPFAVALECDEGWRELVTAVKDASTNDTIWPTSDYLRMQYGFFSSLLSMSSGLESSLNSTVGTSGSDGGGSSGGGGGGGGGSGW